MNGADQANVIESAKEAFAHGEPHPNLVLGVCLHSDGCLELHFTAEGVEPVKVIAAHAEGMMAALYNAGATPTEKLRPNIFYPITERVILTNAVPN